MDKRDKFSGSFRATDGMSGNLNKQPNGPQSRRGFVDYKGGSSDGPPKKLGTTPSSTGIGKASGSIKGNNPTYKVSVQRKKGQT